MFLHFVSNKELRNYNVNGYSIDLEIDPDVFPPSQIGLALARKVVVNPGETVLDIGSGSGIQAIYAAKLGGQAFANDFYETAVNSTIKNAELNNVKVIAKQGRYFGGFEGCKFDVIIANLPQFMLPTVFKDSVQLENDIFDGGSEGNEIILEFLKNCSNFMHANSRVYVGIYTGTNFIQTLNFMCEQFKVRLIDFFSCPLSSSLAPYLSWYKALHETGKIHLTLSEDGTYSAYTYICELTLKN